jgi:hypothetical protein
MKLPPLLLGATFLFWGWQTGFLLPGALMAIIIESSRWVKLRWEFSEDDFSRVWTFCTVVLLAATVYVFTSNQGPSEFRSFFDNPNPLTQRNAGTITARTATLLLRWLPMIFFLCIAAQEYSSREGIPLETVSLILRWRWRRARKLGHQLPPTHYINIAYLYFALCLFSASAHASEETTFFWGAVALVGWGFWPLRSRRFSPITWTTCLLLVAGLGYLGQNGIGHLQGYLGNLNPEWLAGFGRRRFDPSRSQTRLGKIGRLQASGQIVIRLQVKTGSAPMLLREASYRSFDRQTWRAEAAPTEGESIFEEGGSGNWPLLPGKTNRHVLSIACYLDGGKGLLPLPEDTGRLEKLAAFDLQKSSLGAVMASGPGLVVFDALHGPGPTLDGPANTTSDLSVPSRETNALAKVVSELRLNEQNTDQALRALTLFFQKEFSYSTWQDSPLMLMTNETPLARFLLDTRKGHCEYFATAAALLLRFAGIPTRYAVGYAVHEGSGQNYVVRQRDAHAWCLVWDKLAQTWRDFDPTPASWVAAEAQRASLLQPLGDLWSRISFEFSKFRWGQSHLREYLLWAIAPVLAVLLYQIFFRRRRRGAFQRHSGLAEKLTWPGLDSEFFELERKLIERGFLRQPSEPLSEWLQRAAVDPGLTDVSTPLRALLLLHYRYRFDPRGLSRSERDALRLQAMAALAQIDQRDSQTVSAQPG